MRASWHALRAQLLRSSERLSSQQDFDIMRNRNSDLGNLADIPALMDHQHDPGGDPERKDCVLRALVTEARGEAKTAETAQVLALLALWPGLDAIHGRLLRFFRSDRGRLTSELAGRISVAIATADLARINRLAATLLRNTERDLRRMLKAEWQRSEARLCDDLADPVAPGWSDQGGISGNADPEALTRRLRDLIGDDATLVVAVVILGLSQKEAALALGVRHDAARKRYQRAMARLKQVFRPDD